MKKQSQKKQENDANLDKYDTALLNYLTEKCKEKSDGVVFVSYSDILRDLPELKPITQNKAAGVETILITLWCKGFIDYRWREETFVCSFDGDSGAVCEVSL